MLLTLIKHLIETGKIEGLAEKVDVFYLAGKLTKEEYEEISAELNK